MGNFKYLGLGQNEIKEFGRWVSGVLECGKKVKKKDKLYLKFQTLFFVFYFFKQPGGY